MNFFGAPPIASIVSAGAGLFDELVARNASNDFGDSASASASQVSTLGMNGIDMSGELFAAGSTDASGSAFSRLESTFTLASDSEYMFSASLLDLFQGNPTFSFLAVLSMDGGGDVFEVDSGFVLLPDIGDFGFDDVSGSLAAGTYTLSIDVGVQGFEDTSTSGRYDVSFTVPAPACAPLLLGFGLLGRRRR